MRLRVVLPRRRRGAGFRRVTGAALAALALLAAGCGGQRLPTVASTATVAPSPPPPVVPRFAVGITESNPHLLAPGPQPAAFVRARDRLAELRPTYVRVLVDWSHVQRNPDAPPDWSAPSDGCMRGGGPCAPFAGVRDTLRGVRALGAIPVVVLYGTPDWAATAVEGCARAGTSAYSRMPDLGAYRGLVRSLLELGRAERIDLPLWSAWNEPNLAGFLEPQRVRCDSAAPTLAAGRYARLAGALAAELDAAPGRQRLILGEAAGLPRPRPKGTGAAELIDALGDRLVCGASAWSQHAYVLRVRDAGRSVSAVGESETDDLLTGVEAVLDRHHCPRPVPIWITETGVGDSPQGCERMGRRLDAWRRDPRIAAAFQYTFREDPLFPVGLADAGLTRVYPAYSAWRARGAAGCAS